MREPGERVIEDDAGQLPVARDGVLARGDLGHGAEGAQGQECGRRPGKPDDIADAKAAEMLEGQTPGCLVDVAQGVGALVAVGGRVGCGSHPNRVEDQQDDARLDRRGVQGGGAAR